MTAPKRKRPPQLNGAHVRILRWLRDGARVWAPALARYAYVELPPGHPDATTIRHNRITHTDKPTVLRATLAKMEALGLVVNQFGKWNAGHPHSPSVWSLPGAKKPRDI